MKVLVVDDHQNIIDAVTLCINLRWPTATVAVAYDDNSGLQMVETERPDIVVLDIGLPDRDGFDVLRQVRQFSHVPIIMLTVRDSDTDIARALQMGADDYITKPFSHLELLARVEAVLRRATGRGSDEEGPLVSGELWVDFGRAEVVMKGQLVQLTPMELRLLSHLMQRPAPFALYLCLEDVAIGTPTYDTFERPYVSGQEMLAATKPPQENPR